MGAEDTPPPVTQVTGASLRLAFKLLGLRYNHQQRHQQKERNMTKKLLLQPALQPQPQSMVLHCDYLPIS
jgi:hypothetical protein